MDFDWTSRAARLGIMTGMFLVLLGASFKLKLHAEILSLVDDFHWSVQSQPLNSSSDYTVDIPALQEKCNATKWIPGLYVKCDYTPGGIGNQIYLHLACVRYAIQAGAGITLPLILRRDDHDISKLDNSEYEPFEYLFDVDWFKAAMRHNCPQMSILNGLSELDDFMTAHVPKPLHPTDLYSETTFIDTHWREFQPALLTWLGYEPSSHEPAVVRLKLFMLEWDVHDESQAFFATFGRILRLRRDTHAMAAKVAKILHGVSNEGFLGIHLRTEADVTNLWTSYEPQKDFFIDTALSRGLRHIYIASGNLHDVARFREEAHEHGLTVYNKHELLQGSDLAALDALAWDQRALVDYQVLRNATYFAGIALSSFSCMLAYSRHNDITEDSIFPFPQDELSSLMGDEVPLFRTGMWPM